MTSERPGATKTDASCHHGATSAIGDLYDRHLDLVYGFCRARLPVHDAEDVTAEVFRSAAEQLAASPATTLDAAWLVVAARNRIFDRWRRESRWKQRQPSIAAATITVAIDPTERIAEADRVAAALDRLSTDHRAVLVLHYLDDLGVREVAEILGRRPAAIESLLARARRALSAALGEGGRDG